jgi:hypothetical protein
LFNDLLLGDELKTVKENILDFSGIIGAKVTTPTNLIRRRVWDLSNEGYLTNIVLMAKMKGVMKSKNENIDEDEVIEIDADIEWMKELSKEMRNLPHMPIKAIESGFSYTNDLLDKKRCNFWMEKLEKHSFNCRRMTKIFNHFARRI